MAITGKIRERSTLVLIIIGGAIMAFVLTDLFSAQGGGQQGPMNIAEINGTKVSPTEFDFRLQQAYENYQANMETEAALDEETKSQIREQVWNNLLSEILLDSQMDNLGINVTSKELFDMVQGDNPHPQIVQAFRNPETGQFDKAAVVQFLQNLNDNPEMKQRWIGFEQALKKEQRSEKFANLIVKGMYVPTELAKMDATEKDQKVSFKYVRKPYSLISDTSIEVSKKEIQSYYDAHKSDFIEKASRKLLYAYFPVAPSEQDIAITERNVNELYERFSKTENDSIFVILNSDRNFDPTFYSYEDAPEGIDSAFWLEDIGYMEGPINNNNRYTINKLSKRKMAPDSVKARHILINIEDRTIEKAEAIADSLLEMLNSGTKMEDIALENSDDVASAREGGDVGWFTEGVMVKPFSDTAFAAEIGSFHKVLTQFGFHLIEVTDKTELKSKVQIASISINTEPGKETYAEVFNKANSFSIEANDLESFNELVRENNVQRRAVVLDEGASTISGLGASRDLVRWARDAREGDVSEAYDVDDAFVVAVMENVSKDGVAPLEKVKNRVEYLAKQEKKAEIYKQQFYDAAATDIGSLAGALDLTVVTARDVTFANPAIPDAGIEPRVVGKAISLEQGQMSLPIKGETGVFVVQIDSKSQVESPDLMVIRNENANRVAARFSQGELLKALEKRADVTDNRSRFY